jgi:hypothetical protein
MDPLTSSEQDAQGRGGYLSTHEEPLEDVGITSGDDLSSTDAQDDRGPLTGDSLEVTSLERPPKVLRL